MDAEAGRGTPWQWTKDEARVYNRVAARVAEAQRQAAMAITHARSAGRSRHGDSRESKTAAVCRESADLALERTEAAAQAAYDAARDALTLLLASGVERPGKPVQRDTVPLALLNTHATRDLLAALEVARAAARRVDRERGWIDEDGVGTGFEESLAAQHLLLSREVLGPTGKD